jgi:hypothetical protein
MIIESGLDNIQDDIEMDIEIEHKDTEEANKEQENPKISKRILLSKFF